MSRDGVASLPGAGWLPALVIFVPGSAREKTVRIQTDRGHRVIDTGPYAHVRHPGYLGFLG